MLNNKYNKNVTIDIIGYIYPYVEKKIRDMDLTHVNLLGHKSHNEIKHYLENAPYLIISSTIETFSLPIIEAMALGVPVVSTKCGAPEELLSDGRGVISEQNDEKFCDAINLMDNTWMKYDKKILNKWVVDNMSSSIIKLKIKNIVDDILESNKK
jgi:glycosyltransferase involved in cell wall biosynthesis